MWFSVIDPAPHTVYKGKGADSTTQSSSSPQIFATQQRMSLQPYVFPPFPSPQVKAVQEYLKCVSGFDFEGLSSLMMDNFTLTVSPMNLGVPDKTKDEEIAFLKELQANLDGKPLIVSKTQTQCDRLFCANVANLLDRSPCMMSTTEKRRLVSMYNFFEVGQTRY